MSTSEPNGAAASVSAGASAADTAALHATNIDVRLGARVRLERDERGWALSELSERSGVSRSQISKIERGVSSPTAAVIGQLAAAFGLTISVLMGRAEMAPSGRLSRFVQLPTWTDPASGYVRRQVAPAAGTDMPFEIVHIELPAAAEVSYPAAAYGYIDQVIMVLEGELRFVDGEAIHHLGAGDSIQLGAPVARRFHNDSGALCRYINVISRR